MHPTPPPYGWHDPYAYRSTTPRTLGTMSMIFGGIIAAMSALSLLLGKQMGSFMKVAPSQEEAFERYMQEIGAFATAQSVVFLLMSVALFAIGTGQRNYRRWAVGASVTWGAVALVVLLLNTIVQFAVVLPALDRFIDAITHGSYDRAAGQVGLMSKVGAVLGVGFYAPYPIILIVAFRRRHNIDCMDAEHLPAATIHRR